MAGDDRLKFCGCSWSQFVFCFVHLLCCPGGRDVHQPCHPSMSRDASCEAWCRRWSLLHGQDCSELKLLRLLVGSMQHTALTGFVTGNVHSNPAAAGNSSTSTRRTWVALFACHCLWSQSSCSVCRACIFASVQDTMQRYPLCDRQ
jgi:hypothetical protein